MLLLADRKSHGCAALLSTQHDNTLLTPERPYVCYILLESIYKTAESAAPGRGLAGDVKKVDLKLSKLSYYYSVVKV